MPEPTLKTCYTWSVILALGKAHEAARVHHVAQRCCGAGRSRRARRSERTIDNAFAALLQLPAEVIPMQWGGWTLPN